MSSLSDAEKRRILKERRQKKFSNGGASSRLNKIVGQVNGSQLATDSPIDQNPNNLNLTESKQESIVDKNTKEMDELLAAISNKGSGAAAQKAPEASEIPEVSEIPSSNADNSAKLSTESKIELDLLKNLANGDGSANSVMDMSAMFSAMKEAMASSDSSNQNLPDAQVDSATIAYQQQLVNKLKAKTILIKWLCFFIPYIYMIVNYKPVNVVQSTFGGITNPSNFFLVFLSFEIVAVSIYLQTLQSLERKHNINRFLNAGKLVNLVTLIPESLIPIPNLKGIILEGLRYWDVIWMFIADFSFALVMMSIFKAF